MSDGGFREEGLERSVDQFLTFTVYPHTRGRFESTVSVFRSFTFNDEEDERCGCIQVEEEGSSVDSLCRCESVVGG